VELTGIAARAAETSHYLAVAALQDAEQIVLVIDIKKSV
jgi:hypothetical protein